MYQWLDRAPLGRNETGFWWRRHDEYHNTDAVAHSAGAMFWCEAEDIRRVVLALECGRPGVLAVSVGHPHVRQPKRRCCAGHEFIF
jgi:hypothetical protein